MQRNNNVLRDLMLGYGRHRKLQMNADFYKRNRIVLCEPHEKEKKAHTQHTKTAHRAKMKTDSMLSIPKSQKYSLEQNP